MLESVLIANRGEIALRVARTCRELGIRTIACYSTADRDAAVVRMADEAVHLGPAPAKRSYLNMPAIIEAARKTAAAAIHPGYGFLSEDPDFAEVCQDNGIVFIGPPPKVMAELGDKARCRTLMAQAGLPVLPGSAESLDTLGEARALAEEIGFPVIVKAVAGGGGRGVNVVTDPADFASAYTESRASAQILFNDNRVYVERYLPSARHVEVQVLCDQHGNAVHLGERDCSVQRRHQKLIEEAPAPNLSAELVESIRAAAVRGALAVGYVGVGTFEFLVGERHDFYLMEVNCRLQVEHPVTELVTGIDLVREQLLVASGEPLAMRQSDIVIRGAAIECRINAEDPDRDFAPTAGTLETFTVPGGPFVRIDTHAHVGYRIPPDYDSLLAKAAVWAPDRDAALDRMLRTLGELEVRGPGVRTSTEFLASTVDHPLFRAAKHDTGLIELIRRGA